MKERGVHALATETFICLTYASLTSFITYENHNDRFMDSLSNLNEHQYVVITANIYYHIAT